MLSKHSSMPIYPSAEGTRNLGMFFNCNFNYRRELDLVDFICWELEIFLGYDDSWLPPITLDFFEISWIFHDISRLTIDNPWLLRKHKYTVCIIFLASLRTIFIISKDKVFWEELPRNIVVICDHGVRLSLGKVKRRTGN